MVSRFRTIMLVLLFVIHCSFASAQRDVDISVSAGFRAYFSKTSTIDRLGRYSLNYHAFSPGYYTSLNVESKNFFLRPTFSRYGIVHTHGVYNITIFTIDSPRNKNIRNTNSMMEFSLDFGYEFEVYMLTLRIYAGGGLLATNGQEWKTSNMTVPSIATGSVEVATSLEVLSQSFSSQTYASNFGFGMYLPIYRNLLCELDVHYQTHFNALASNTGTYRIEANGMPGFGGEFNSILMGAWILQVGIGYRFN